MLDRIVGWFETFIGVVESGGVEGADTGGLGLATLVSNGLQVVIVTLMMFLTRKQTSMRTSTRTRKQMRMKKSTSTRTRKQTRTSTRTRTQMRIRRCSKE